MAITHMTPINSLDELLKKMSANKIKNILIGNGFSLSHPTLKDCFEWDMHQALCASWSQMIPDKTKGDPEKDLNAIRKRITKSILQYYIDRLKNKISSESENLSQLFRNYKSQIQCNCSKFLSAPSLVGGYIFTLNYDPLLYFEILKLLDDKTHVDGFVTSLNLSKDDCYEKYPIPNSPFLNQDYIKCKLEEDKRLHIIKVLYLHGSWFIQANDDDELRKLSFRSGSLDSVDSLFDNERRPFLIFEDRWRTKKAILESDPYLKFCYDQLGKIQGNVLVFGCSFNNDEHILQALNKNTSLKQIYITCLTEADRENLERNLSVYRTLVNKTEYLNVSDNVIWEKE